MFSKKRLLSNFEDFEKTYKKRHEAVKKRIERRRCSATDLEKTYAEKTNSLNRLRNK